MDWPDRYQKTVEPTAEPVTLDEAKQHCYLTDSTHDVYLSALITKARDVVEKRITRQLMSATWRLSLDEFPDEILLTIPPIQSVSSIVYTDTAGTSTTLAASQYQVDASSKNNPARIKPAYGLSWPTTRCDTYNAVVVTFLAGYTTAALVPTPAKHAILMLVGHWFEHREPVNIGNIVTRIPQTIDWLLASEDWGCYA
jgi:uncharacterized phiE125 gp8 family phage protein